MTAFFVGQRVRLVRVHQQEFMGAECRIVSMGKAWFHYLTKEPLVEDIELDLMAGGAPAIVSASQLEPILPSGHRPAELTVEELLPFLNERAQA